MFASNTHMRHICEKLGFVRHELDDGMLRMDKAVVSEI